MIQQDSDPVKLLVTFSSDVDLHQIITNLTDNYHFVQHVAKFAKSELLISFYSMSELLEIDFVKQFGALSTKVRNSNSFCKEMSDENHASTEYISGTGIIYHDPMEVAEAFPKDSNLIALRQRLTSIDHEVCEQQEKIQRLTLFDQKIGLTIQENQLIKSQDGFEKTEQHQQQTTYVQKQGIWGSIFHGMILTSLLVGGAKAIKLLF